MFGKKEKLSLAHMREAEGFENGIAPKGAVRICSNGWVTMYAQSFEDGSVLVIQEGEQGIEEVSCFYTQIEAGVFFNALSGFSA